MRLIPLIVLLCAFSEVASAQSTSQCQSIPKASERLVCYDRASPPPALSKPAASKTPAPQQGQFVDQLTVENSKLDAKLKTICRGC
jgi:hypothetical protein